LGAGDGVDRPTSWFAAEEAGAVRDFWLVYQDRHADITQSLAALVGEDSRLSAAFGSDELAAGRRGTLELVLRGVEGDWSGYEQYIRRMANEYARVELSVEGWHRMTGVVADALTPALVDAYGADPPRLKAALQVLHRFLGRGLAIVGSSFMHARQAAVEDNARLMGETLRALEASEQRLRALAGRLQSAIEDERARIAREAHDDLGQQLTALKLELAWLVRRCETDEPAATKARLQAMIELVDGAVDSVRQLATRLRPGVLDDLGLIAAIEWHCREFRARTGMDVALSLPDGELEVPPAQATAFFRILQELLTNVARHAQATRVDVAVSRKDEVVVLEVRDDGRGITEEELAGASSLGIVGMRERAGLLGGHIAFEGAVGRGTAARVQLPAELRG
jgi:signal transduction histidine kinase